MLGDFAATDPRDVVNLAAIFVIGAAVAFSRTSIHLPRWIVAVMGVGYVGGDLESEPRTHHSWDTDRVKRFCGQSGP
jgi:hypothetical protein